MRYVTTLLTFALWLTASPAWASLTQIFNQDNVIDRSAWELAVGGPFALETFDDATLVPGVSITSAHPLGGVSGGEFIDLSDGLTRTQIDFVSPVLAFGGVFDLDPGTAGTGLDVHFLFSGGGSEIVEVRNNTTDVGAVGPSFTGFVGAISNMPITQVLVFEGNQTNLGGAELYHLDDMVFATTVAAPEPTTAVLLGFAVALVGAVRTARATT